MNAEEFRVRGKEVVDYIADYLENIREKTVFCDKKPGFLKSQIPEHAPAEPQPWTEIFKDFETFIMPGVTHWQSPRMHAYFGAVNSYPSILGEMLSDAISAVGFTWASNPSATELEMIVMNWLAKMIGLPDCFLHNNSAGSGGGVIQSTVSESTLVALLAARAKAIKHYSTIYPAETNVIGKLVAYTSDQAHSSVEKAGLIGFVEMRFVESDSELSMRGDALEEAIRKDKNAGLIPFYVCATLGTTGTCSFDNLREIGKVCQKENLWFHVDAAYGGCALVCPEFRKWIDGIEYVESFCLNTSKCLLVNFECTAMWVKDSHTLYDAFNVNPLYLQHQHFGKAIDFMHWQIPLAKRFRALKLWFVIRNYGITGLQNHLRHCYSMAAKMESLLQSDSRFEIPLKRHLGLIVFRLRGDNSLTEKLWEKLYTRRKIHVVPYFFKGTYVIRYTVMSSRTTHEDIQHDWEEIKDTARTVLMEEGQSVNKECNKLTQ